jgi:sugar phosphate isomerase/epimerase
MLIGAMNNPRHDVLQEIEWISRTGMDFVDLTLEPPVADVSRIEPKAIRAALEEYDLGVVGHTAYYLPLCSPFESLRRAAVEESKRCIEAFSAMGAAWMNLHPDRFAPMHDRSFIIERNIQSLLELLSVARDWNVGLMIENLPGHFNTVHQLAQLLDPLPELGLHLDIGHCNLLTDCNTADEIMAAYGSRLRHVHLHDNKGGNADLHLPLGTGTVDVPRHIRALQASGYDGTITLEVFSPDRHYLAYSRDVLRRVWDEPSAPGKTAQRGAREDVSLKALRR